MENINNDNTPIQIKGGSRKYGLTYGVYAGIAAVVLFIIFELSGLNAADASWAKIINILLSVGVIAVCLFMAQKTLKSHQNNFLTYGQGVSTALWLGLVTGFFNGAASAIYYGFISDRTLKIIINRQLMEMKEQGLPNEMLITLKETMQIMQSPGALFGTAFFNEVIIALIIGLVVAAFTKSKFNPEMLK